MVPGTDLTTLWRLPEQQGVWDPLSGTTEWHGTLFSLIINTWNFREQHDGPPGEAEHAYTKPHPHPNPVPSKCIFLGVGLTLSQPSRPLPQNIIHKKHHICINLLIIGCFKASPVFLVEIRPGFTFSSPPLWHQTYSFLFVCCFHCCCCCCCPPISFSLFLPLFFDHFFLFFFPDLWHLIKGPNIPPLQTRRNRAENWPVGKSRQTVIAECKCIHQKHFLKC